MSEWLSDEALKVLENSLVARSEIVIDAIHGNLGAIAERYAPLVTEDGKMIPVTSPRYKCLNS
jgi:hypothetical protein